MKEKKKKARRKPIHFHSIFTKFLGAENVIWQKITINVYRIAMGKKK